MTRRLAALLLAAAALTAGAGAAAADEPSGDQLQRTHVVCVGGSNDASAFEGVCAWVPLPV